MNQKIQELESLIHLKTDGLMRVGEGRELAKGRWHTGGYRSPEEIRKALQDLVQRYQTMDSLIERQRSRFNQWNRQELPENPRDALPVIRETEAQLEREWLEWRRILDALRQGFEDYQEPVIPEIRWQDFFVRRDNQVLIFSKVLEMASKLFSVPLPELRELVLWVAAALEVLKNGRDGDGQVWSDPNQETWETAAQYLVHLALQKGSKGALAPWEKITALMGDGQGRWRHLLSFPREYVRAALILGRRRREGLSRDELLLLVETLHRMV